MKISEFKGSEVLPEKKKLIFREGEVVANIARNEFNNAIDAYTSVEIDGYLNNLTDILDALYPYTQRTKNERNAKSIVSQMPKWVVLRKGK